MPNKSKQKGDRFERELVKWFLGEGIRAEKIPLSGAIKGGSFEGDLNIFLGSAPDMPLKLEAKKRANGFKEIYKWVDGVDMLVIGADCKPPLIVLPLEKFIKILKASE